MAEDVRTIEVDASDLSTHPEMYLLLGLDVAVGANASIADGEGRLDCCWSFLKRQEQTIAHPLDEVAFKLWEQSAFNIHDKLQPARDSILLILLDQTDVFHNVYKQYHPPRPPDRDGGITRTSRGLGQL